MLCEGMKTFFLFKMVDYSNLIEMFCTFSPFFRALNLYEGFFYLQEYSAKKYA